MIEAITAGAAMTKASLPAIDRADRRSQPPADVVELLKVLLKRQCERFHVAPKLVASASDIEAIALDDSADVPAMTGWRREIFGELALRLKRGEVALRLKDGAVELVELGAGQ
jgi:ribonuclease D